MGPGAAYIASPNRYLLLNPGKTLSLSQSEWVHFLRPSPDLMFESVAAVFKDRSIALIIYCCQIANLLDSLT